MASQRLRRTYSTPTDTSKAYCRLPSRAVLSLSGDDSTKFLQGMITNHMPLIERGGDGFYSAFLNAQGRVLYDAFIYPKNQGTGLSFPHPHYLVEVDAKGIDKLAKHLKLHKLRAKVEIRNVNDEYDVWAVWNSDKTDLRWANLISKTSPIPAGGKVVYESGERPCEVGTRDLRCPGMGYRMILPKGQAPKLDGYTEVPEQEYTIRRILRGIPEGMDDLAFQASLPLESNFDYMSGVDFRKGCYVGQELTVRTYHTGVTRKRILPVQFYDGDSVPEKLALDRSYSAELPPSQSDIFRTPTPGAPIPKRAPRPLGKFCSGIHNIGLGLVRLDTLDATEPLEARFEDQTWRLRPFLPAWWPQAPRPETER